MVEGKVALGDNDEHVFGSAGYSPGDERVLVVRDCSARHLRRPASLLHATTITTSKCFMPSETTFMSGGAGSRKLWRTLAVRTSSDAMSRKDSRM